MSQKNKNDAPKEKEKKALTVQISFSTVTTLCVILLSCFCLTFILGVIVGRGDNPEAHLPELTAILPKDSAKESDSETVKEEVIKSEVMPKEELNYSSSLKDKVSPESVTNSPTVDVVNPAAPINPAQTSVTGQDVNSQTGQIASPASATSSSDPAEDLLKQVVNEPDLQPVPSIFDFTFQVATFTDEVSVDRLRARLEGEGLRTKMEKTGKFYKVMVLMRGSNEQAQDLRKLMVSMKLGEPLQRSKKAIEQ